LRILLTKLMSIKPSLYQILGVPVSATTTEIKSRYRYLAKQHHPDKKGDAEKFKEVSHAYKILRDDDQRRIYDKDGYRGLNSRKYAEPSSASSSSQTFKIASNNEAFSNLFKNFFGENSLFDHPPTSDPDPICQTLRITLKELYLGCQKTVKYSRKLICQGCYGKGHKPHQKPSPCYLCHGQSPKCQSCEGRGQIYDPCRVCSGSKLIDNENTFDIAIKSGMNDKIKLKYENLGNEEPGKTPGDLIIDIVVENNTDYIVEGSDLKMNLKISLVEALGGVQRDLVFIDGTPIRILTDESEIIQQGEIKIYKGNGLPIYKADSDSNQNQFGDLIIHFEVEMPKKLTPTVRKEILQSLRE
jgi:DnaJ family protein A protein 2